MRTRDLEGKRKRWKRLYPKLKADPERYGRRLARQRDYDRRKRIEARELPLISTEIPLPPQPWEG